ncbi:MAG TPA: CDP-alcohol phosphatidyltransferase family protein [Pseudonocardia sp.]|nr:CDP-alcohol phosphatidyltransferase family protein [Pseudonocardia sp.]
MEPTAPPAQGSGRASGRIVTVPNALSVLRLAGVPLFLWLLLGPKADGYAVLVLVVAGFTDWLDGKAARWLNQYSRLGELLDPAADRLYILATLLAFLIRGIVPWWVVAALVGRDVVLAICVAIMRRRGYGPFPVTYLGKAATFNLLYAFPLLLLAQGDSGLAEVSRALGYAFTVWGGALYLWSGFVYLIQFGRAMRRPVVIPTGGLDRLTG